MAISTLAALAATPIAANADSDHWCRDNSRHSEYLQKRQTELHDKLGLSASQQPAWNDFITKTKPAEHQTRADWSKLSKLSTPERLDFLMAKSKEHQQALESHTKVVKTFYSQLNSEQQKIFDDSFHFHGHEHGRWNRS